jgi:hypothetical protein
MTDATPEDPFAELRKRADQTERRLNQAVANACPAGPDGHLPTQHRHRDRNPPWCNHCRRTDRGVYVPTRDERLERAMR